MVFRNGARSSAAAAIFLMDASNEKCDFKKIVPSLRPRRLGCGGSAGLIFDNVAGSFGFFDCSNLIRAKRAG